MIKLDNNFLEELGLGALPDEEKKSHAWPDIRNFRNESRY